MSDSKEFQNAESIRSGKFHVRSGKLEERNSSNAQIWTLLDEQRQMIIAEYCEIPEGMLRPSFVSPRRKEGPAMHLGYTW